MTEIVPARRLEIFRRPVLDPPRTPSQRNAPPLRLVPPLPAVSNPVHSLETFLATFQPGLNNPYPFHAKPHRELMEVLIRLGADRISLTPQGLLIERRGNEPYLVSRYGSMSSVPHSLEITEVLYHALTKKKST